MRTYIYAYIYQHQARGLCLSMRGHVQSSVKHCQNYSLGGQLMPWPLLCEPYLKIFHRIKCQGPHYSCQRNLQCRLLIPSLNAWAAQA